MKGFASPKSSWNEGGKAAHEELGRKNYRKTSFSDSEPKFFVGEGLVKGSASKNIE